MTIPVTVLGPRTLADRALDADLRLGILLAGQGRFAESIAALCAVLAVEPGNVPALANLGWAFAAVGQLDAAISAYDAALRVEPERIAVRDWRASALLKAGRLAEGFAAYEWRQRRLHRVALPAGVRWLVPGARLAGKTVLLMHEGGMGDTLMMLRYVPLLALAGARVVVCVPPELARIARAIPGVADVLGGDAWELRCHWYAPVLSLPHVFATTLETIPPPAAIVPNAASVARWAARLPACAGRRVGLCWAGLARQGDTGALAMDHRRSLPLAALAPLGGLPGVQFVSLQKGPPAAQTSGGYLALHDPMPEVVDFADTAAIIANLDAVISADTAVAHLAASMGKRVLLLDRFDNCWIWLTGRDDSPWYPSLRIVRQHRPGDWADVVARVCAMDLSPFPL